MVKSWYFSSGSHTFATIRILPTQASRSCCVSPNIEASWRARIPFLPAKPPVLVLWLNQVIQRFYGELPQTPCADSGFEPLPCTTQVHDFILLFLPPCGPHLILFGHQVHRAKPTCLTTPRKPARLRHFVPALDLHQCKSSHNMHMKYSSKN
jgi:hypothetical protein